jgi:exodeoxyribonuclease-3
VGLVSRAPMIRRALHAPRELAHCMVEAEIPHDGTSLTVYGLHMVSATEEGRLREVEEILRIAPPSGACALLGDLNRLARHDPYAHDLADRLRACRIDKYGHPPSFEVMRRYFDAGWIDALHHRPASPVWITARRGSGPMALEARTDYVLLSPEASARLVSAQVVDVGDATDHNAVIAELR